jgi:hypothetical protein
MEGLSAMAITEPSRIESELSSDLRQAVLKEIDRQGIDPETLARNLDLVPTAVRALLNRDQWSLKTALVLVEGLGLPLHVRVDNYPAEATH